MPRRKPRTPARLEIFIDGAARGQGNPGLGDAACGVVIYRKGKLVCQYARALGKRTSNEAEYEALLAALQICWGVPELADPVIYSDSRVVVQQVTGKWRCRFDSREYPLYCSVKELANDFRFQLIQIGRIEGCIYEADRLANLFLDRIHQERENMV